MAGYQPLKIAGFESGLVQEREEFLLPNDAYPILQNAYVWRERIKRKKGYKLLGRLRRNFTSASIGLSGANLWSFFLFSTVTPNITEAHAEIQVGTLSLTIGATTITDQGNGTFNTVAGLTGTINYATGAIVVTGTGGGGMASTATFSYFPGLPAMGLRDRELNNINQTQTVAFDQTYAYVFIGSGWQEFITGTTWTGTDSNFFWSTNYWISPAPSNNKIFWVTNFSGTSGDPIRYTDSNVWINFAPTIDAVGTKLQQCLAMLPFRGRLVTFNTYEGTTLGNSGNFQNRIRWAAIGNPISDISTIFPLAANVNASAWRSDIRGQGGFLDIPTSESITAVGFVRDNLVVYCERSTWQLRYTGRSIAPFQIERVNTELGADSTFSAVQFDTSLVGVGDKGVVECDSYKAERIDIKIPDLVYYFKTTGNNTSRVHGIRDFQQRLAYWTYPYFPDQGVSGTYPNRRLVYNYENDSWAIFTDSLTCLGNFQNQGGQTWVSYATVEPGTWQTQNYPWINFPALFPEIVGGNQQGWIEVLTGNNEVTNDVSLSITGITGNSTAPTVLTCINHNLQSGQVIQIFNIPAGTPFASDLNGNSFGVEVLDANSFQIWVYNPASGDFDVMPEIEAPGTYIGGGQIAIRDGFRIVSKKFNFIDDGQNIQIGFIDILLNQTTNGAITLNAYLDYQEISQNFADPSNPANLPPQNNIPGSVPPTPDTFFNSVVPTSAPNPNGITGTKYWQRIFCPLRAAFLTLEWNLSNGQLVGVEQQQDVQIDAQIIYMRKAGRYLVNTA